MNPIALATLHAGFSHSSLALRSIAAFCRDEPFYGGIRLFESTVKTDLDGLAAAIAAERPRLVGLSAYLWNIQALLGLAERLRAALPGCAIVLGGPEAGPRAEAILAAHPAVDFVVDGEGEEAFLLLARHVLSGAGALAEVPGLVRREGGGLRRTPTRPVPPERLVSPLALGLLDRDKPLIYWETSRGCPFRCTFCTSAADRLRTFPEARIAADLEVLSTLENRTVKLLDRSFHLGEARTLDLLERFLRTPDSLRFHLELNPDRISEAAMALFARAPAGKFQFEIGLQTLDTGVLARIERRMEVPKALDAIRRLVAMGRHPVHLDLIVGLPGEDAVRCRRSLDAVFALGAGHLQLGTLKLLPGTPLREQAPALGYDFDPEPPYEVRAHPDLSAAEFGRFKEYAELLERVWNNGLLIHTLRRAVAGHFDGSVSRLFDRLLASAPELTGRPGPERVFELVGGALGEHLEKDAVLCELFCWDYGHYALPGNAAPAAVREAAEWQPVAMGARRKRRPVFRLSPEAAAVVNGFPVEPVEAGRYMLWPQKHLKGRPVQRVRVDP